MDYEIKFDNQTKQNIIKITKNLGEKEIGMEKIITELKILNKLKKI